MLLAWQVTRFDSVCIRCGYSLRGLAAEGNCPECGLGIVRSLALGQQLRQSRPAWIASLAWAARWLLASGAILLLAPFAGLIGREMALWLSGEWNSARGYRYEDLSDTSVFVLAATANLIGSWMLTRRENPHAAVEPLRDFYLALRICSLGPLLASLLWLSAALMRSLWWNSFWPWDLARQMEHWGNWIVCLYTLCPLLQFHLLRRLAARVLNRRLLEHTNIAGIGFSAGAILLLVAVPVMSDWKWGYQILNSPAGYAATLLVGLHQPVLALVDVRVRHVGAGVRPGGQRGKGRVD